ncbi:TetR family transcriptional regulator [Desulfosporosinus sp. PR]|uniref:TetR family transcriptional regulator n=1 Tax=Candidatus Desulfosporosinus nitrosoreducens TaxID=3401928 RepID=UPI0027F1E84D|nr:TetR family transcriptional regulator [Desulfosporosinus sp. PR]MDQ7095723.1 TetR family transcriptional regulator [Desulfosporosinus sp. PR]
MEFERARNEAQKSTRRDQIMEAALKLYETEPFEKITLASIANKLSFSRANLYKYVTTKEEIFLRILNSDLEKWVEEVAERLEKYDRLELKSFCRLCAELLYQNERIIRLFPILASVLETNVKPTELAAFKHNQNKSIERLKTISAKFLPDLSDEQLYLFIRYQILYALNLYPETVLYERGSAGAGLLNRKPNFITDFSDYLEIIILGIRAKNL